jgi:hypothetical protein
MPTKHLKPVQLVVVLAAILLFAATGHAQNPAVNIAVDATANRHPINPNIYGVAHASSSQLNDLNSPLNRNGGNNTTRYNWQLNADNRANDWYFESIGDSSSVAGERGDTFIFNSKAANAQAMLTIPTIGWVAKLGSNRNKLAGFSIAKDGAQTGNDSQWFPDAGNGILTSGQNVTGNDPNDANVSSDSSFQQAWHNTSLLVGDQMQTGGCVITFSTMNPVFGTRLIATCIRPARRWTRSKTKSSTMRPKSNPSTRRR